MNRLLVLVVCFAMSACASIPKSQYIRVDGAGTSFEAAKQNAFKNAIEFHVGAVVVSERETQNMRLAKDEILAYSSGYVDDYKIISQHTTGEHIYITTDVIVASNKIANRILGQSTSVASFDKDRHVAQTQTYINEKNTGDKILQNIINDYPQKAINVTQKPHTVGVDRNRQVVLNIPYKLSWNYNYIVAIRTILDSTEDGKINIVTQNVGHVIIVAKGPTDWFMGKKTHHQFSDLIVVDKLHDSMVAGNEIQIRTTIRNTSNQIIRESCVSPRFIAGLSPALYGIGDRNLVVIYGNAVEEGIQEISMNTFQLSDISDIQMQIVKRNMCGDK